MTYFRDKILRSIRFTITLLLARLSKSWEKDLRDRTIRHVKGEYSRFLGLSEQNRTLLHSRNTCCFFKCVYGVLLLLYSVAELTLSIMFPSETIDTLSTIFVI